MSSVQTEFSPDYFRAIFGDDRTEWLAFKEVNVRTFSQGLDRLRKATESGEMDVVSEVRHAMGPSLKQWGTVTLEARMIALNSDNLTAEWPGIDDELKDLISALEGLK